MIGNDRWGNIMLSSTIIHHTWDITDVEWLMRDKKITSHWWLMSDSTWLLMHDDRWRKIMTYEGLRIKENIWRATNKSWQKTDDDLGDDR